MFVLGAANVGKSAFIASFLDHSLTGRIGRGRRRGRGRHAGAGAGAEGQARLLEATFMRRLGSVHDIADAVLAGGILPDQPVAPPADASIIDRFLALMGRSA